MKRNKSANSKFSVCHICFYYNSIHCFLWHKHLYTAIPVVKWSIMWFWSSVCSITLQHWRDSPFLQHVKKIQLLLSLTPNPCHHIQLYNILSGLVRKEASLAKIKESNQATQSSNYSRQQTSEGTLHNLKSLRMLLHCSTAALSSCKWATLDSG